MVVCLACRHASADRSVFCAYCARSLNCRVCEEKHRNSLNGLCCTTCGSLQLSEGTRALQLGGVSAFCTGFLALLLWKWCLAHAGEFLKGRSSGLVWGMAFFFNSSIPDLQASILVGMTWLVMLWMLGHFLGFLPGKGGQTGTWLRSLPLLLFRQTLRLLCRFLQFILILIRRALVPAAHPRNAGQNAKDLGKVP